MISIFNKFLKEDRISIYMAEQERKLITEKAQNLILPLFSLKEMVPNIFKYMKKIDPTPILFIFSFLPDLYKENGSNSKESKKISTLFVLFLI